MQVIKSPEELLSAADIQNVHTESQLGRFPYTFSFNLANDRYSFQMTSEEVQEVSNAAHPAEATRAAFGLKISRIIKGRVNSWSEATPHLKS